MSNALVLSGGSVKGCFQAGAIKAVIESGFIPDTIYGISVGSLNGSFLAQKAGERYIAKNSELDQDDWNGIANDLWNFWVAKIKQPDDVAIERGIIGDVIRIAINQFNGLSDTTPINTLVDGLLKLDVLRASPVDIKVGAVDFITSDLSYVGADDGDFINHVKGSIAIPIAMPPAAGVMGEVLLDGGTREVAPLGVAINDGAGTIVGILCQSKDLNVTGTDFNPKNLMKFIDRLEDIIVNQNVKNDSEWITFINKVVSETQGMNIPSLQGYKLIKHLIIQPDAPLNLDITTFTEADILSNLQLGYRKGQSLVNANPVPWLS